MSITIGWWGLPALITGISFGWLLIAGIRAPAPGGYASIDGSIVWMFFAAVAAIISLIAWLIWAVLT